MREGSRISWLESVILARDIALTKANTRASTAEASLAEARAVLRASAVDLVWLEGRVREVIDDALHDDDPVAYGAAAIMSLHASHAILDATDAVIAALSPPQQAGTEAGDADVPDDEPTEYMREASKVHKALREAMPATPPPVASDALVQELVDTLKPFAELARFVSAEFEDSYIASWAQPTVDNLRRAATLLDRIEGKQVITQKTVTVTAQVLITPIYRAAVGGDLQQAVARQLGRELGEQIMQHLPPPVLVPVAPEPGSLRLEADQPNFDVFDARYEASVTFVVPK